MAKISVHEMFPSKWLSSADLNGRETTAKIANPALSYEKLKQMNGDGSEEKAVLHFHNPRGGRPLKPMVLNKVNLTTLIVLFGDDDDNWAGQQIKIGVDMVPVGKEVKPGLRIRTWQPEESQPAVASATARMSGVIVDGKTFANMEEAQAYTKAQRNRAEPQNESDDPDLMF